MSTSFINAGLFGEISVPPTSSSVANYRAFDVPKMNEGVTLLTYMVGFGNETVEMHPTNIASPPVRVNEVGHITLLARG
jgi:hypothetical protein